MTHRAPPLLGLCLALGCATFACSAASGPPQPPQATTATAAATTTAATSSAASPASAVTPPSAESAPRPASSVSPVVATPSAVRPPAAPSQQPLTWPAHSLDARPASHLATGKRRAAALVVAQDGARQLVVFEFAKEGAEPAPRAAVPLPDSLQAAALEHLRLFMGRDDWPRVIVTPPPPNAARSYYRYRPNQGWQSPADEQGALAAGGAQAGYYGFLGHQDPEVLCVPEQTCYEKRTQGWTQRPVPGPGTWNVTLTASDNPKRPYDAWAWPAGGGALLTLETTWTNKLPAPGAPLRQMLTWNGNLVALTDGALLQATTGPEAPVSAPSNRQPAAHGSAWTQLTRVTNGTSLLIGSEGQLLVGTRQGLVALSSAHAPPVDVRLTLADGSALERFEVRALLATLSTPPRYLAATNHGVLVFGSR